MSFNVPSNWLYENHCGGCGKVIRTPTIGRTHTLETVYCSRVCETIAKNKQVSLKKEVNCDRPMPKRKTDFVFPKNEGLDFIEMYGSNSMPIKEIA